MIVKYRASQVCKYLKQLRREIAISNRNLAVTETETCLLQVYEENVSGMHDSRPLIGLKCNFYLLVVIVF